MSTMQYVKVAMHLPLQTPSPPATVTTQSVRAPSGTRCCTWYLPMYRTHLHLLHARSISRALDEAITTNLIRILLMANLRVYPKTRRCQMIMPRIDTLSQTSAHAYGSCRKSGYAPVGSCSMCLPDLFRTELNSSSLRH